MKGELMEAVSEDTLFLLRVRMAEGTREILCFFGGDYLREQTRVD
jgi:hypothetical protein